MVGSFAESFAIATATCESLDVQTIWIRLVKPAPNDEIRAKADSGKLQIFEMSPENIKKHRKSPTSVYVANYTPE